VEPLRISELNANFSLRVAQNQQWLVENILSAYDFVICGAGSSGSVVARRLAENENVKVLLLEAGGSDDSPSCTNPNLWPSTLKSDLAWQFETQPEKHLLGRILPYPMGKVLGGGSSINACVWLVGHKSDWDFFAEVPGIRHGVTKLSASYITGSRIGAEKPIYNTEFQHTSNARLSRSSCGSRNPTVRLSEWPFDGIGWWMLHSRIECA
jgi:choline dehydrogenase-like flavoprotein